MGVVIRQSFWGSAILYVGVALGYLNTLLFMPTFLDIEKIGLIRLIQTNSVALLLPLATMGMAGSLVKYYPHVRNKNIERNSFVTLQLLIVLVSNLLISGIVLGFKDYFSSFFLEKSPEFANYIHISLTILLAQSVFEYFVAMSRSQLNIIVPSLIKEVFLRLLMMGLILLFGLEVISFDMIIMFIASSYLLATILIIIYNAIKYKFKSQFNFFDLEKDLLIQALSFAGYSLLLAGLTSILTNISFILTSTYLGLEETGIFTICAFIGIIIELPKRAANQIIGPLISEHFKAKNIIEVEKIYQKASINLGVISLLLGIGIFTNIQDLFLFIPKGEQIQAGFYVVLLIGLSKIIAMIFGPNGELLIYSNQKQFMIISLMISTIILVLLNMLLIPIYGINGAAIATLTMVTIDQLIKYLIIRIKLQMKLFTNNHIKLLLLSGVVGLAAYYVPVNITPLVNIVVRSLGTVIVFVGLTYLLKVSTEVNNTVQLIYKRLFNDRK